MTQQTNLVINTPKNEMAAVVGNMNNETEIYGVMESLAEMGHIRVNEKGHGTLSLYLPKVHPSTKHQLRDLFERCGVGRVVEESYVPRLDNRDRTNSLMGFVKIIPYATPEFYMLANDMVEDKKTGYLHYQDKYGNERYLIVCINTTPEKEVEKKKDGVCVMEILEKQENTIKEQSVKLTQLEEEVMRLGCMMRKLEEAQTNKPAADEIPKKEASKKVAWSNEEDD